MLNDILTLKKLAPGRFESMVHQESFRRSLFGGQVLGQALMAAGSTVETDRQIHSLHAYFLRAGKTDCPVLFEVESLFDGRSFSNRSVRAYQNDKLIFNMMASFHIREEGLEYCGPSAPPSKSPEYLLTNLSEYEKKQVSLVAECVGPAPIDFVPSSESIFRNDIAESNSTYFWVKSAQQLETNALLNSSALLFASDIGLLATALLPHNETLFGGNVYPASVDHAIWFHNTPNFNHWHQYVTETVWSGNARGLCRGFLYSQSGKLVASVSQEGLIRPSKGQ